MNQVLAALPLLAGALAVSSAVGAQAAEPADVQIPAVLTLQRARDLFRTHGFDLLVADAQIESAAGDVGVAGAVFNPTIGAGYYQSFFTKGLFETNRGWFASIGDSNAIEDSLSGKRHLRVRMAEAALAATKLQRADAERVLGLQLQQSYFQAALASSTLAFAKQVADSAAHTFELNQIRYKSGAISEVDLSKTETAKLEAEQAVESSGNAVRQSKITLAFLLGRRQTFSEFEVAARPADLVAPASLTDATAASLVQHALENRPDLQAQTRQREKAAAGVDLAHRLRFPDLGVSLQYQQEGSGSKPADATQGAAITPPTLLLSLTTGLPLFYQQQGEIRKTEADLRAQEVLVAKARAQVVADVDSALSAFTSARKQVERMQGRLLDRAKRTRDLVELQYQKGSASLLEYLDAQRTYIATNLEYFQDLNGYWNALLQLEAATGTEIVK